MSENAIPGSCFTNLDDYKDTEWPTHFVTRPIVGDYVEGRSRDGKRRPKLCVIAITHTTVRHGNHTYPTLTVELHR